MCPTALPIISRSLQLHTRWLTSACDMLCVHAALSTCVQQRSLNRPTDEEHDCNIMWWDMVSERISMELDVQV